MTGPALRAALEGYEATTLLERSRNYQQYIRENLLEQVPTADAEVFFNIILPFMLLHPILTIIPQFEEVGSQTAGEAMEEHIDTERAETDRASPSQHTETVRGESSSGITLGDISLLDRSMYYWAPVVQTPIEQHIVFDETQPPVFTPPDASHVSIVCYFICIN